MVGMVMALCRRRHRTPDAARWLASAPAGTTPSPRVFAIGREEVTRAALPRTANRRDVLVMHLIVVPGGRGSTRRVLSVSTSPALRIERTDGTLCSFA